MLHVNVDNDLELKKENIIKLLSTQVKGIICLNCLSSPDEEELITAIVEVTVDTLLVRFNRDKDMFREIITSTSLVIRDFNESNKVEYVLEGGNILENSEYILEMRKITKSFPGVKALDNVQLKIKKGEVHALMGENGAGKSTLMKILAGLLKQDMGEILIDNKVINIDRPLDAIDNGISMIHQELNPIPEMSVSENIYIGREILYKNTNIVNKKAQREGTKKLLTKLEINISPTILMKNLSIAEMQMIEISKAISYKSNIIIMDEPTSAITDKEVESLFKIIKQLSNEGVSIIYISHKMNEIYRICERITILRDGLFVGSELTKKLSEKNLIKMMVGRELTNIFPKELVKISEISFEVKNLSKEGIFSDISFSARKGEILGVAGLMGAGRTEVAEAIFGIDPPDSGKILVNSKVVKIKNPRDAIRNKIALITEDRKTKGLNLKGSVKTNISIVKLDEFCMLGQILQKKKEQKTVLKQIDKFDIKTPSENQLVSNLSGGNQQKIVLAKWLLNEPDIVILDEPTRGIDIGAKSEIYKIMTLLVKQGKTIIMISSELPEILGMSDRVIVLSEGRITGEFNRNEMEQEKILSCAMQFN